MEYTIGQLAKLSGLTTRTLRYYDEIGLLEPSRVADNGYRMYDEKDVDRLQQILYFRVLRISPLTIRNILDFPGYDAMEVLKTHVETLTAQKEQLEGVIANVEKTIADLKGEHKMTDKEKFEGLKIKLLAENEEKYGSELMAIYGETRLKKSRERFAALTQKEFELAEKLAGDFEQALKEAARLGDPACAQAREACSIHRQWISIFWSGSALTPENHLGLAQLYCRDERFARNMEALAQGRAELFHKALLLYYDL